MSKNRNVRMGTSKRQSCLTAERTMLKEKLKNNELGPSSIFQGSKVGQTSSGHPHDPMSWLCLKELSIEAKILREGFHASKLWRCMLTNRFTI